MKANIIISIIIFCVSCSTTSALNENYSEQIVYQVDFSHTDRNWIVIKRPHTEFIQSSNSYDMTVDTIDYMSRVNAPYATIDFEYSISTEVKIELQDSTKIGFAGLMFDFIDEKNYSIFYITNNGTYKLYKYIAGKYTQLIGTTISSAINKNINSQNILELRRKKSVVELLINNQFIIKYPLKQPKSLVIVGLSTSTYCEKYYSPVKDCFSYFILKRI